MAEHCHTGVFQTTNNMLRPKNVVQDENTQRGETGRRETSEKQNSKNDVCSLQITHTETHRQTKDIDKEIDIRHKGPNTCRNGSKKVIAQVWISRIQPC